MKSCMAITGIDLQPKNGANQIAAVYFIIFIVAGCYFALNLFVGMIIHTFSRIRDEVRLQTIQTLILSLNAF